jgi:ankyrin repeat protein
MFKRSVSAPNAAPATDSAPSIAAKKAPDELQSVIVTQNTAAAGADTATEERRPRTAISTMTDMAAPPTAARAAPAPREPTERTEVTAARRTDPAAELWRAAEIGDVAKLQTLLDRRAESVVDARDEHGRTALMLATLHGRAQAVDVLLAHGADPNAADARGTTPLQAALAGHQTAIAAALQLAGARAQ